MKISIGFYFSFLSRKCVQRNFRVAVQNERYDDWSGILVQLRRLFAGYLKIVLEYHSRPGITIPSASNSTATQGNFLEVLNISLNGNKFEIFNKGNMYLLINVGTLFSFRKALFGSKF